MKWKIPSFLKGDTVEKSYGPFDSFNMGNVEQQSFTEFLLGGGGNTLPARRSMTFYQQSEVVASVIDKIAREIEMIQPVLMTEEGDFDTDAPVLDLIRCPNNFETSHEFIGQLARYALITGDAHVYAGGAVNRPPLNLYAIKPQTIAITTNNVDHYPELYTVDTGMSRGSYKRDRSTGTERFFSGTLREIYQIKDFSSGFENTFSDSPLLALRQEVQQQLAGRMHNLKLLENGGRLSLIATFKGNMSADQQNAAVQTLQETLGGPQNAGKIAISFAGPAGADYTEMGSSNKDMDFINLDVLSRNAIARRYNVPLQLISTDSSTFNNMETANTMLYRNAVLPLFTKIYSGLSKMLLPRYGYDINTKARITYNPEHIEALRLSHLDELAKKHALNALTTNEIRMQIGLDGVEGGDDIMISSTLVPLGSDMFVQ
jgi:HK97 family phage portal protein